MDESARPKNRHSIRRVRKQYTVMDKPRSTEIPGQLDKKKIGNRMYRTRPRKLPIAKDWEAK